MTFVYGPGDFPQPEHASHAGKAYGFIRNRRFGDLLRVKMPDGTFETVASFTTVGIGAYLFPWRKAPTRTQMAEEKFRARIMKAGGLTDKQADVAFATLRRLQLVTTDIFGKGIVAKNPVFVSRQAVRRAAGLE